MFFSKQRNEISVLCKGCTTVKIRLRPNISTVPTRKKNYWLFKQCLDKKTLSHKVYSAELPSSLFFFRKIKEAQWPVVKTITPYIHS